MPPATLIAAPAAAPLPRPRAAQLAGYVLRCAVFLAAVAGLFFLAGFEG